MQPRLQLTEDPYNHWSARKQDLLVECEAAHKISVIQADHNKIMDRTDWIPFEEIGLMAEAEE